MYNKVGKKLFLPEGDDYSKTEFDIHSEELEHQGRSILEQLREKERLRIEALRKNREKTEQKGKQNSTNEKGKTYKEILDEIAAKK